MNSRRPATKHYHVTHGGLPEKVFKLILAETKHNTVLTIIRFLAGLVAWSYGKLVTIRNFLFDHEIIKVQKLDCRIISVGNLAIGGTGKTPMVLWLAQFLSEEGWRVAIVSRGYRSEHPGRLLVVSDGQEILVEGRYSGDEPQLLARRLPGIPVLCSTKRAVAVEAAIKRFQTEVVILDDGFQHRFIARDLDLVMLDAEKPFGNGRLFPRGVMREQATALSRAQALVLSRFDDSSQTEDNREILAKRWPDKPIFTATHNPARLFEAASGREQLPSSLENARMAAFAGIERPDDFFKTLIDLGADLVYSNALSDHHSLTRELLESLMQEAEGVEPEIWITTEKDWVRLPDSLPEDMNLWILAIDLDLGDESSRFQAMLLQDLFLDETTPRSGG